ncbi:MAG TPA: LamG-like jellyroll fold domain-containing protein [Burkholderiales bacterium]|nr:LamG-like jellyroll fold domain-containing protein [Burkholderiales bacterium]
MLLSYFYRLRALRFLLGAQVVLAFLLLATNFAFAGQASLAWDASASSEAVGYMLHYGQTSGAYTGKVDVGNKTGHTVTGLSDGKRYYFAVTAYDASRTESDYSNEASSMIASVAPTANFTANPTSGVAPLSVAFTSNSTGSITGYSWKFGDGGVSASVNPTHSYATPGTYSVSLTVTGPGGSNTQTKSGFINVTASSSEPPPNPGSTAPVANFTASATSGPAPLTVNFTSTSTGTISAYAWSFGSGATSAAQNPSYTFTSAGTYSVTLKVTNAAGSDTETKTSYITVGSTTSARQGLVAAYSFDEGGGSTVADRSGKGNKGTLSDASWANGRFGKALSFNGSSSRVNIEDSASLDLSKGMTLEAWVYPTATMSGWRTIIMKELPGNASYYLYANTDKNQPSSAVYVGGERTVFAGKSLPLNTWTHLAATYDGATQRFFMNGAQVASRQQTGSIAVSEGRLRIGGNRIWNNEYFKGLIDEVRIYNRPLTATEIQADMNASVASTTN